ncbi:hypothetical protein PoB_000305600, partial [Plakobranchus ocellatus]
PVSFSVLSILLGLAAIFTYSQATFCTDICNGSCDYTETFINHWMEISDAEIAQNAEKCNKVCNPVCNCIDNCFAKCLKELGTCRINAGDNPAAFFSCQVAFSSCGAPCDNQCAAAVNLAAEQLSDMSVALSTSVRLSLTQLVAVLGEKMVPEKQQPEGEGNPPQQE